MKTTIKEIADRAGVHRSTVDKVLHNRVGVSSEVRSRVQQIIDEMGYKPNPAGQILQKQGKTYKIAAILVEVDVMPFLIQGIEQGVKEQTGLNIEIIYRTCKFNNSAKQCSFIDEVIDEKVDAIILSPMNTDAVRKAINRAADAGIPVVTTNSDVPDSKRICCIAPDGLKGGRIAGRLLGLFLEGRGKVAVISSAVASENNNYYVHIREKGFVEFVEKEYPGIEIAEIIDSFEDVNITYKKTVELLEKHPDLRGIYITCGGASQVGYALRKKGNEKVRIVSFEDYPEIIELIRQGVIDCTLSGEMRRQGKLPVQILMDYLVFGKKPEKEQVHTEIKILIKENI